MGWGRTLLLGDVGNRLDIGDCERDIASLRSKLRQNTRQDISQNEELQNLRRELDEVKLCLGSLTRILTANGLIDAAELARFAKVIDDDEIIQFLNE